MSVQPSYEPECAAAVGTVDLMIEARARSLGEFDVRRVLPAAKRRMVGPFDFFDHMGPAVFPPGRGIAVRPHPHIGLATVTYLFEGEIMHRDSLGYVQPIQAGAVNLMTAGRGIVHSERASDDLAVTSRLHGIQSWVALPESSRRWSRASSTIPRTLYPSFTVGRLRGTRDHGAALARPRPSRRTRRPSISRSACRKAQRSRCRPTIRSAPRTCVAAPFESTATRTPRASWPWLRRGATVLLTAAADSLVMVIGGEPSGRGTFGGTSCRAPKRASSAPSAIGSRTASARFPDDDEFIPLPER